MMNGLMKRLIFGKKPDTAPKCIRCGHEPCPGCETWCDITLLNIYCPKCESVIGEVEDRKDGDEVSCTKCGDKWNLHLAGKGHKEDDVDVDLCCDGKCDWNQSEKDVQRWCEWQK
jgi:hypothetical protein